MAAAPSTATPTNPRIAGILDHLKNVGSDPTALKWILGGAGAAGLAGGVLSARGGLRRGESPSQRRRRIILNALGSGVVGGAIPAALAGGASLISKDLGGGIRSPNKVAPGIGSSLAARGVYGGALGAVGRHLGIKSDRNYVLDKLQQAKISPESQPALGENFTHGNVNRAFDSAKNKPLMQAELQNALGSNGSQTRAAVRALGHSPVVGERAGLADDIMRLGDNIVDGDLGKTMPAHVNDIAEKGRWWNAAERFRGPGRLLSSRGVSRRALGGAAGLAVGALGPEIMKLAPGVAGGIWDTATHERPNPEMPAPLRGFSLTE